MHAHMHCTVQYNSTLHTVRRFPTEAKSYFEDQWGDCIITRNLWNRYFLPRLLGSEAADAHG